MIPPHMEKISEDYGSIFKREFVRKDGVILDITQHEVGDVGCVVWDAAIVLSYYLESNDFTNSTGENILRGKRVIELGSGTGLVGIQAAACGANCTLTDLEHCLPLMQLNLSNNFKNVIGKIDCKVMIWGSDVSDLLPSPDFLLLADCIYYEESLHSLVKTISELCDYNTVVLCCYEMRTSGNKPQVERQFFKLLELNFVQEFVPISRQDPVYRSEDIVIIKLRKKRISTIDN